jgi:type IV secretory pathway VirJ component
VRAPHLFLASAAAALSALAAFALFTAEPVAEGAAHVLATPVGRAGRFDPAVSATWTREATPTVAPQAFTARSIEQRLARLRLPLSYVWPRQRPPAAIDIFVTGDGGWASLDHGTANELAARGIAVVALSSLRYFWYRKTPEQVTRDLEAIISSIGQPVFIGGYSFGAEVVPVVASRWADGERAKIRGLALVSPGPSASFKVSPLDWLRTPPVNPATLVAPAVRSLDLPTVCVMGATEKASACASLPGQPPFTVVRLPGGHHLDGNYKAIGDAIAKFIGGVLRN